MGKGIEEDVEPPTDKKRENVSEEFPIDYDQHEQKAAAPDDKGMKRTGKMGIPEVIPDGVMHPFYKAMIKENPRDKGDHVNQIRQKAPYTNFPSP